MRTTTSLGKNRSKRDGLRLLVTAWAPPTDDNIFIQDLAVEFRAKSEQLNQAIARFLELRRAVQDWDGKLRQFADKYSGDSRVLKSHPTWQKLMRMRNTVAVLAELQRRRLAVMNSDLGTRM